MVPSCLLPCKIDLFLCSHPQIAYKALNSMILLLSVRSPPFIYLPCSTLNHPGCPIFSEAPRMLLSQGLETLWFLCLRSHPTQKYPHGSLPHFLQVSSQMHHVSLTTYNSHSSWVPSQFLLLLNHVCLHVTYILWPQTHLVSVVYFPVLLVCTMWYCTLTGTLIRWLYSV